MTGGIWTTKDDAVAYAPGVAAPTVRAEGSVESRLMSPRDYSLWCVTARLADGASLHWDDTHGDEIVYVMSGELDVDGRRCPTEGAVLLEAQVPGSVKAVGLTEIVHFGPWDPTPPADGHYGPAKAEGRAIRVVGPRGMYELVEPGRTSRFFAESASDTCRLTLLYTARDEKYVSSSHTHSEDEIIYVTRGSVITGGVTLLPGDVLGIAGDQRYGFRTGDDGMGFLNYRRDVSWMTRAPGSEPFLEGGVEHSFVPVMDLR